jgi:hypothetical protein
VNLLSDAISASKVQATMDQQLASEGVEAKA